MKEITYRIRNALSFKTSFQDLKDVEFDSLRKYNLVYNTHHRMFRRDINEGLLIWSQLKIDIDGTHL